MKFVFALAMIVGCSASTRQKAISDTLAATNAASVTFATYDHDHQLAIVSTATDKATGETELQAWRVNQLSIEKALAVTFQAIATEATLDNDPNYSGMVSAARILLQTLKTLGVVLP